MMIMPEYMVPHAFHLLESKRCSNFLRTPDYGNLSLNEVGGSGTKLPLISQKMKYKYHKIILCKVREIKNKK